MYVLFIDTYIAPERTWSMANITPLGFSSAKSSDQWIGAAVFWPRRIIPVRSTNLRQPIYKIEIVIP